jgi:hypothetical protein
MTAYTAGRDREYRVARDMAERGGWVQIMRSAGSKGPADLLLAHPDRGTAALVQVKKAAGSLGPKARADLCYVAELAGALPILADVIPYRGISYWLVKPELPFEGWTP